MRTFSKICGPHSELSGSISFEITYLPDLLNETRTFSELWGPHCKVTGPTFSKLQICLTLLMKRGPFPKYGELIVNLLVQLL